MKRWQIAAVTLDGLSDLLAGRTKCVNWPADARITRTLYDPSRDAILLSVESLDFPPIPDGHRFLEMRLLVEKTSTDRIAFDFLHEVSAK